MRGKIMLVGGAGYVGSITAEYASEKGYEVVVVDNFYQGHRNAIPEGVKLEEGSMGDARFLDDVFARNNVDGVILFAGETLVEYSMKEPFRFFKTNVTDGMCLLNAMVKHGVCRLVFSSTSAIYGEAKEIPMTEEHQKHPANSYGQSKWIFEQILKWYYEIHGLKSTSFRYFNAAGASRKLGEDHRPETHLIPLILKAARTKSGWIDIFGDDYATRDGTCVRDYTHVLDLAQAHLLGLEKIEETKFDAFNLGNGSGYTVKEVIQAAREVTGLEISEIVGSRRLGDASIMVASSEKAKKYLGWNPIYPDIHSIVQTAWDWHVRNPDGYTR